MPIPRAEADRAEDHSPDVPAEDLVADIREADGFLAGQKKLYGKKDEDLAERAMHAVMIVSGQYADAGQLNAALMATTLEMVIAKKQAARISLIFQILQALGHGLGGKKGGETDADSASQASTISGGYAELNKVTEMIKFSSIIVAAAPMLIVYPFVQKYFEKGFMAGAVKG